MNVVELLLTLQNQFRVYHWQTKSFAEHKAFDDIYTALDPLIDQFMEVYMGKNGRPGAEGKFNISLMNYDQNVKAVIGAFVDVLVNDFTQALDETDTDLLNIRDEILAELNKLRYLLTLA